YRWILLEDVQELVRHPVEDPSPGWICYRSRGGHNEISDSVAIHVPDGGDIRAEPPRATRLPQSLLGSLEGVSPHAGFLLFAAHQRHAAHRQSRFRTLQAQAGRVRGLHRDVRDGTNELQGPARDQT